MKLKYIIAIIASILFLFTGCQDEEGRVVFPFSSPKISSVSYSITDQAVAADSIFISLEINDPETPLSTLEVKLTKGEDELYSKSIRTKGNFAQINKHGIYIPFSAGFEEEEATLLLTAINVEGSETSETKSFMVKRPILPETIYLHYDNKVLPMSQSSNNPYDYTTKSGEFPETFSGKISTDESLENSKFIWGLSENVNEANIGSVTSPEFSFDYTDWSINKITFNTFTFNLGIEGTSKNLAVNDVTLNPIGGYFYAVVYFEEGQEVEVTGIEDLEGAYNRDFFEYNKDTGKLTFLRESGSWEVYYSTKFNYMWMARMDDIAPEAFWLIGHGFISAPVWNDEYNYDGWSLDDIARMGYVLKIGENKYQSTVYLSDTHEWGSFEVEMYTQRKWDLETLELSDEAITGDREGFALSQSNGFTIADGFVPGYFRLTFDTSDGLSKGKMHIERLED